MNAFYDEPGPYWVEYKDDGDTRNNVAVTRATAAGLKAAVLAVMLAYGEDHEEILETLHGLVPGQQFDFDLPNGRLYFGVVA